MELIGGTDIHLIGMHLSRFENKNYSVYTYVISKATVKIADICNKSQPEIIW